MLLSIDERCSSRGRTLGNEDRRPSPDEWLISLDIGRPGGCQRTQGWPAAERQPAEFKSAGFRQPSAATATATVIAAPTMPASLCSAAGTTVARSDSFGKNLSDFLLMPPPMMIRSGDSSSSILSR